MTKRIRMCWTRQRLLWWVLGRGVGFDTTGIMKFSFWRMTVENPQAVYVCVNYGEADYSEEIARQTIYMYGDIGDVIMAFLDERDP